MTCVKNIQIHTLKCHQNAFGQGIDKVTITKAFVLKKKNEKVDNLLSFDYSNDEYYAIF